MDYSEEFGTPKYGYRFKHRKEDKAKPVLKPVRFEPNLEVDNNESLSPLRKIAIEQGIHPEDIHIQKLPDGAISVLTVERKGVKENHIETIFDPDIFRNKHTNEFIYGILDIRYNGVSILEVLASKGYEAKPFVLRDIEELPETEKGYDPLARFWHQCMTFSPKAINSREVYTVPPFSTKGVATYLHEAGHTPDVEELLEILEDLKLSQAQKSEQAYVALLAGDPEELCRKAIQFAKEKVEMLTLLLSSEANAWTRIQIIPEFAPIFEDPEVASFIRIQLAAKSILVLPKVFTLLPGRLHLTYSQISQLMANQGIRHDKFMQSMKEWLEIFKFILTKTAHYEEKAARRLSLASVSLVFGDF